MSILKRTLTVPEVPAKPETTKEVNNGFKCDYCGKTCREDYSQHDSPNWDTGGWDHDCVVIKRAVGSDYPGCHNDEIEQWDVCPECFDKYIRPVLPKVFRKHEIDW